MSRVFVELRAGEELRIGNATIRLEHKSGQRARLAIEACPETRIITPSSCKADAVTDRGEVRALK